MIRAILDFAARVLGFTIGGMIGDYLWYKLHPNVSLNNRSRFWS